MKVLGYIGGLEGYPSWFNSLHDSAAALIVDGEVVAACEEERFTRNKHTGAFPANAIRFCLDEAGLRSAAEVDLVCYGMSLPLAWSPRIVETARPGLGWMSSTALGAFVGFMRTVHRALGYDDDQTRRTFERQMGVSLPREKYRAFSHHVCHMASAYYPSPFDSALCLTLDAQGESNCSLWAHADGMRIRKLGQVYMPNSLGYFYTALTLYLGFDNHDEYKVMGLAPYGDPNRYGDAFRRMVKLENGGRFFIDPWLMGRLFAAVNLGAPWLLPSRLVEELGPPRAEEEAIEQRHMDIAAALQRTLEETVTHTLEHMQRKTGERNLCLAGGVALNCTMNGKLARSGMFDGVFVQPASHDAGTALGAAAFGYHNVLGQPRSRQMQRSCYLGPALIDSDIDDALRPFSPAVEYGRPDNLHRQVAHAIADGKVIGWYQGRAEWGPRALGNRSILADPRRADMKDIVNRVVKLREGFRPFAPACLLEESRDWFDLTGLEDSPYMLFCVDVHPDKRHRVPAVTHVDGSARLQTVSARQNPAFHSLVRAFKELTGVPVLLNTSFNVKGEAIVNSPLEAIRCFLGTGIDLLVIGDVAVQRAGAGIIDVTAARIEAA